jgi:F-type H+-transporting ATPase subunit b
MNGIFATAEFWQAISFCLFLVITFRPISRIILGGLDKRSVRIKNEVEEMDRLIHEVGLSLDQVKSKYDNIDKELETIARNTEREIDLLKKTFEKDITLYINQKTKQLVEKIAADERKALEKLRLDSVNNAIVVAGEYIDQLMNKDILEDKLKESMQLIEEKLKV